MFVVSFLLIWSSNPEYVSLLNPGGVIADLGFGLRGRTFQMAKLAWCGLFVQWRFLSRNSAEVFA